MASQRGFVCVKVTGLRELASRGPETKTHGLRKTLLSMFFERFRAYTLLGRLREGLRGARVRGRVMLKHL